jgi:spore photoproduct lyase
MRYFKPERVLIEAAAQADPFARQILGRIAGVPCEVIEDAEAWIRNLNGRPNALTRGKKLLLLRRHHGRFFKPFPLIPGYLSCHFQVLHLGSGCDLDCTYCILQAYLNNPAITVYTNFEEGLRELDGILTEERSCFFRVTTGELIDSLSLDHITRWSVPLVRFFAGTANAVLELKTKSDNIAHLKEADPRGRVIVSWSMNSEMIQRTEELKCATLAERIEAARRVQEWGYLAGFHFDPLIVHEGWEAGYARTVAEIFASVREDRIAWISLGALRFMGELKKVAEKRFPRTPIFSGEFVRGLEGKYRYFKPIRKRLYTKMRGLIRRYSSRVPIYLCMEGPELWQSGLETPLSNSRELGDFLDRAAGKACETSFHEHPIELPQLRHL